MSKRNFVRQLRFSMQLLTKPHRLANFVRRRANCIFIKLRTNPPFQGRSGPDVETMK